MEIDPCSEYYVQSYFNLPEVQEAIHANVTKLHYDWQPCRFFAPLPSLLTNPSFKTKKKKLRIPSFSTNRIDKNLQ